MPASAGRVRMPHNNRVSVSASLKSSSIWQNTIGHDPYASQNEPQQEKAPEDDEKAQQVYAMARQQNLTDGSNRNDFARKLYLGLKGGKMLRRGEKQVDAVVHQIDDNNPGEAVSSSEDEYLESDKPKQTKQSGRKKKKKGHRRSHREQSSSSRSSEAESDEERRKKSKRRQRDKKTHRRKRSRRRESLASSDDEPDREEADRKKRHKHSRKKEQKKRKYKSPPEDTGNSIQDHFRPAEAFEGSIHGYIFQNGAKGLGYYSDKPTGRSSTNE